MVPISGCLLDVDGTLIDSNDAHARAWSDAFSEAHYSVEFSDIRSRIGMGGDQLIPDLIGLGAKDPKSRALQKRRGEIFRREYLPKLVAFDGARELLQILSAKGYQLVIATSASDEDLRALLKQTSLEDVVSLAATASDAEQSKPEPDIVLAALRKIRLSPGRALMFGDTPYDIKAAQKAEVKTLAFTCGGWTERALMEAGAWSVYENPRALLEDVKTGRAPF
jgi:HAD superfamily hydrolase (TIGR01509 family)